MHSEPAKESMKGPVSILSRSCIDHQGDTPIVRHVPSGQTFRAECLTKPRSPSEGAGAWKVGRSSEAMGAAASRGGYSRNNLPARAPEPFWQLHSIACSGATEGGPRTQVCGNPPPLCNRRGPQNRAYPQGGINAGRRRPDFREWRTNSRTSGCACRARPRTGPRIHDTDGPLDGTFGIE